MKSIFLQVMAVQLACALLTAAFLWRLSEHSFIESMSGGFATNGQTIAQSVAKSVELPLANRDLTSVQGALDAALRIPDVEWAYVTAPDNRVLADTFVPAIPGDLPLLGSNPSEYQFQLRGASSPVILFTQPVLGGIFGAVHVGLGTDVLMQSISRVRLLIAMTLGSVIFVLTGIVGLVTRRILRPIRVLTQASLAMTEDLIKDFQPIAVSSRNEIGTLTHSFNRMILERQEYRKHLEIRVAARTQELLHANHDLDEAKSRAEEASASLQKLNEVLRDEAAERKLLEGQLVQAQKLESIGQLAAGIAHEVNTPIQYIGDNCQFLKTSFAEFAVLLEQHVELLAFTKAAEPAAQRADDLVTKLETSLASMDADFLIDEIPKAIDQAIEGVGRVSQIVKAMKEFSHPGSGEKSPADLNRAIINTLAVCRHEVKYLAHIVTDLDPALPPVYCFLGEINQVILNLVVNAAHAQEGKRNSGVMGNIKISTRHDGTTAEIRVQDDGQGIPEAIRDRVFDPFFTTKEVGKGTGQGLAIARNTIAKKHGGTLTFETEENAGTTFIIRIPIVP